MCERRCCDNCGRPEITGCSSYYAEDCGSEARCWMPQLHGKKYQIQYKRINSRIYDDDYDRWFIFSGINGHCFDLITATNIKIKKELDNTIFEYRIVDNESSDWLDYDTELMNEDIRFIDAE
jgi:hypothetical protein